MWQVEEDQTDGTRVGARRGVESGMLREQKLRESNGEELAVKRCYER
jgi:hypothetical protein